MEGQTQRGAGMAHPWQQEGKRSRGVGVSPWYIWSWKPEDISMVVSALLSEAMKWRQLRLDCGAGHIEPGCSGTHCKSAN